MRSPTTTVAAPSAPCGHPFWMPWVGRSRPATPSEERSFVAELEVRADGRSAAFRRTDVTALLNALRCGLRVADLLDQAPGLDAAPLHTAYCELELRRAESSLAWHTIAVAGRLDVFARHRDQAAKLVPVVIDRLDAVVRSDPDDLDLVLLHLASEVASTGATASRIERELESVDDGSRHAAELTRVYYGPAGEGITGRPEFLAHRVGALVPARVAALLDDTTGTHRSNQGELR